MPEYIDCACLIHDVYYSWEYVEKLYNSLCRNLTPKVRMHVYTEASRNVPAPFIHHPLVEWPGIGGPKSSWWYKIQLFNPEHHKGNLLYFDLDTVITSNIDWIWKLSTERFWAVKDFKYLYRSVKTTINSSVMWFDTEKWAYIFKDFNPATDSKLRAKWYGDQDYIHDKVPDNKRMYFDVDRVKSWRWEILDGGYDFRARKHKVPGQGTVLNDAISILVFHGSPKPHEVTDPNVLNHWQ